MYCLPVQCPSILPFSQRSRRGSLSSNSSSQSLWSNHSASTSSQSLWLNHSASTSSHSIWSDLSTSTSSTSFQDEERLQASHASPSQAFISGMVDGPAFPSYGFEHLAFLNPALRLQGFRQIHNALKDLFWAVAEFTKRNKADLGLAISASQTMEVNDIQCSKCLNCFFGQCAAQIQSQICETDGYCHYIDDHKHAPLPRTEGGRVMVALDCEMVRTSHGSELAHIVIVDECGSQLASWRVRPKGTIIDLLTPFSGIQTTEEITGPGAIDFDDLFSHLTNIGVDQATYIVGHGLESDLRAMRLSHERIIDTAVLFHHRDLGNKRQKLRDLASQYLGRSIQGRCHDPLEDAVTANDLTIWYLHNVCSDILIEDQPALAHLPIAKRRSPHASKSFVKLDQRICHECGGSGHMRAECPAPKRPKNKKTRKGPTMQRSRSIACFI